MLPCPALYSMQRHCNTACSEEARCKCTWLPWCSERLLRSCKASCCIDFVQQGIAPAQGSKQAALHASQPAAPRLLLCAGCRDLPGAQRAQMRYHAMAPSAGSSRQRSHRPCLRCQPGCVTALAPASGHHVAGGERCTTCFCVCESSFQGKELQSWTKVTMCLRPLGPCLPECRPACSMHAATGYIEHLLR